jgi:hypothetical protein
MRNTVHSLNNSKEMDFTAKLYQKTNYKHTQHKELLCLPEEDTTDDNQVVVYSVSSSGSPFWSTKRQLHYIISDIYKRQGSILNLNLAREEEKEKLEWYLAKKPKSRKINELRSILAGIEMKKIDFALDDYESYKITADTHEAVTFFKSEFYREMQDYLQESHKKSLLEKIASQSLLGAITYLLIDKSYFKNTFEEKKLNARIKNICNRTKIEITPIVNETIRQKQSGLINLLHGIKTWTKPVCSAAASATAVIGSYLVTLYAMGIIETTESIGRISPFWTSLSITAGAIVGACFYGTSKLIDYTFKIANTAKKETKSKMNITIYLQRIFKNWK